MKKSCVYVVSISLVVFNILPNRVWALDSQLFWQLQFQRLWQEFDKASLNNPENVIYQLDDLRDRIELRPDYRLSGEYFLFELNPRVQWLETRAHLGRGSDSRRGDTSISSRHTETTMRYANLQLYKGSAWLKLGRYVRWWGAARLLSPSNPYHEDTGQSDQHSELNARDYLEFGTHLGNQWQVALNWNFGDGEQRLDNFKPAADLQLTWQSPAFSISGVATRFNTAYALGAYGQWTVNDALILYADMALSQGRNTVEQRLLGEEVASTQSSEDFFSGVWGLSYTFESGMNVALDYFSHGAGLSSDESKRYFQRNQSTVRRLLNGQAGAADNTIVRELSGVPFYRMNTDFGIFMLLRNGLYEDIDIGYLLVKNFGDHSAQHNVSVDYRWLDSATLYANVGYFSGADSSEFGRFLEYRMQLGIEYLF